jgi:hypothetical protein
LLLADAATGQVAILQIRVLEGEGAVHVPGMRSSRPITVEITDETGKPVPGAAVSFHLPEEGSSGAFVNGLRTEVTITDARGLASVHGLQVNRVPGRFQIRILVSKEQARAGIVSFQYVSEPKGGVAPASLASAKAAPATASRHPSKWLWVALAVGGGAAAALVASRGSSPAAAAMAPAAVTASAPVLTIGSPTITVGKP